MPVARIITTSPADNEELRRQLIAAGYSVKFAAPNEEFSDADIVVAAANVHADYALQYASEVAAEAGADVIVAPGLVAGSAESVPAPSARDWEAAPGRAPDANMPAAGILFGTANEVKDALADGSAGIREALGDYRARLGSLWLQLKHKRDLAAERKRLQREQHQIEREEQLRVLQQQRTEAEARMAVERERLRAQRQVEQERLRHEQAAMRRAMEEERARIAAERERMLEQERAREAEHEVVAPTVAPVPPIAPANTSPAPVTPAAPVRYARPYAQRPVPRRPVARRASSRERRFQKAALFASIVALLAMLAFAVTMNIHPSSPIPHSMVQNPVQEKSPFGAASITPATTTPGPAAKPAAKTVAHTAMPQSDKPPAAKPAAATPSKPSPSRPRHRAAADDYVAEDEVVVHHYGTQPPAKHPPSSQTQAGIRKYSDRD